MKNFFKLKLGSQARGELNTCQGNSTYSKDNIINTFKLFIYIFDSFNRLLENSFFEVIDKKENNDQDLFEININEELEYLTRASKIFYDKNKDIIYVDKNKIYEEEYNNIRQQVKYKIENIRTSNKIRNYEYENINNNEYNNSFKSKIISFNNFREFSSNIKFFIIKIDLSQIIKFQKIQKNNSSNILHDKSNNKITNENKDEKQRRI